MSLTARMIDAIEHPLVDQTITITTRAQPWVDELIREAKAQAWDEGKSAGHENQLNWDGWNYTKPEITNPYRSEGEQ